MDDEPPPLVMDAVEDPGQRSLIDDVRQLADDGKTLVEAELTYQKSRAAVAGTGLRGVAAWGGLALASAFFALMALIMGALLALSDELGPWPATAIVVAAVLLIAVIAALMARARWSKAAAALAGKSGANDR